VVSKVSKNPCNINFVGHNVHIIKRLHRKIQNTIIIFEIEHFFFFILYNFLSCDNQVVTTTLKN
jgi:hypothetical protein